MNQRGGLRQGLMCSNIDEGKAKKNNIGIFFSRYFKTKADTYENNNMKEVTWEDGYGVRENASRGRGGTTPTPNSVSGSGSGTLEETMAKLVSVAGRGRVVSSYPRD